MALRTWHQVKMALCDSDPNVRSEAIAILGSNIQSFRAVKKSRIVDGPITNPYVIVDKNRNTRPINIKNNNIKKNNGRSHSSTKSIRNLGYFVSRFFNSHVTREIIIEFKPTTQLTMIASNPSTWNEFITVMKDRDDKWWDLLISSTNSEIDSQLREAEDARNLEAKFYELVNADSFLREHNIALREIVRYDRKYFVAKIYLPCGGGFYEGSLKEILQCVREQLEENDVYIRSFCPLCTGKQIRFDGHIGLCLTCGTIYDVETSEVLKKYDMSDKDRWVALALVDPVFHN